MAPTAYAASGRLNIQYTTDTLVHKMRIPCDITNLTPGATELGLFVPVGGQVVTSSAAQALWNLMRPNFAASVPAASYLLEQNSGGIFTPVESAALTGAGSSVGPVLDCSEVTLTYKDLNNHKLKLVLLESSISNLAHSPYPVGDAPLDALILYFLTAVNPTDGGNWARSRGDVRIFRFTFFTASLNKRIRRSRHLV